MNPSSATRSASIFNDPRSTEGGPAPILVGIEDVARMLNISSRTVWTLTVSGNLPHVRIGRRVLFPVDAVREWTASRISSGRSTSSG